MTEPVDISVRVAGLHQRLAEKLGGKGDFAKNLKRRGRMFPKAIRKDIRTLMKAEPMLAHPKLRLTQDQVALSKAVDRVQAHVKAIDLADRRKGWLLGVLGGLAFNFLLFFTILVVIYVWRTGG